MKDKSTVYVDLHVHSTASDGSFSPREVVIKAKSRGLQAIALTDHDTVDGLEEALAAGKEVGLEVIPGIEISAEHEPGSMHILGYFIDFRNRRLAERLQVLQRARAERNPQIIAKLRRLGIDITLEEVAAVSGSGQMGRPHIARVLLNKGYVADLHEAFERYIGNSGPAYVRKFRFPPREAIGLINDSGGVASLAHPFTLQYSSIQHFKMILGQLRDWGLVGLEVYYPEHSADMQETFIRLAEEWGLLCTGGSDFHGANKPGIELGQVRQQRFMTYKLVEKLKAKLGRKI
ncbi:MAG TPA: phosphoesterase [Desulfobacterales bacterium]|nr:phosphoesterase [Desulfobacterales bacterium]